MFNGTILHSTYSDLLLHFKTQDDFIHLKNMFHTAIK